MGLPSIGQGYDTGRDPRLWGVPYSRPDAGQGFLTSELQLCPSSMRGHHSLTPGGRRPPRAGYGYRDSPLLGLVGLGPKLSISPESSCCPTAGEETGVQRGWGLVFPYRTVWTVCLTNVGAPLPWGLMGAGLRPGQAAPTWRAAVDEEGQPCSQAKTGQEGHRSWERNEHQGLPVPWKAGKSPEAERDRLVSHAGVSQAGTPPVST